MARKRWVRDSSLGQELLSPIKPVLNIGEIIYCIHPCGGGWRKERMYPLPSYTNSIPWSKSLINRQGGCSQATNSLFSVALLVSYVSYQTADLSPWNETFGSPGNGWPEMLKAFCALGKSNSYVRQTGANNSHYLLTIASCLTLGTQLPALFPRTVFWIIITLAIYFHGAFLSHP